ncbi:uncharacterized protein AB9W97_006237 isoform 2-T4 [Spinachia spinachia]
MQCDYTQPRTIIFYSPEPKYRWTSLVRFQSLNDTLLPVGETNLPTKKDIHAAIAKKLSYYYDLMREKQKNSNKVGEDSTPVSMPPHLHTSAASKDVARHNGVSIVEPTAALEKPSTEVPGTTREDQRKKRSSSKLNRNVSQEKSRLSWLNVNTNSDDMGKTAGVFNHCTERENRSAAHNIVETERLDYTQDIADQTKSSSESGHVTLELSSLTEYQKAKKKFSNENSQHHRVICKEGTLISNSVCKIAIPNMLSIPTNQSNQQSRPTRRVREEAASACSQATYVPVKKPQKHPLLGEGMVERAYEQYEDISDDDMPYLTAELPNTGHWEVSSRACFGHTIQAESTAVLTTMPSLVAAPSDMHLPGFGNGHVQGHAQIETPVIAQQCSCSFYFERRFCPKCYGGRQVVPSAPCRRSSVLDREDEMDDDHLAIPISIFDLKFEPEEGNQDSLETTVSEVVETEAQERQRGLSRTRCPSPTAFPSVQVFDTPECFLQAVQCETINVVALGSSPLVHETDSEGPVSTPPKRRESVDSCDTEDSCDYSSASEHNFLTVSRKMMSKGSATDDSLSKEEGKDTKVRNIQKDQMRRVNKLNKWTTPRRPSEAIRGGCKQIPTVEREDIIVLDSDMEDDSVQTCKRKQKQGCTPSLDDIADASCSQQKSHSPGTESPIHPSASSPTAPRQSRDNPVFEEEMQDIRSDTSQSIGKGKPLIPTKDDVVYVQHKTYLQKSSPVEGVIVIIDSDAEDDEFQDCVTLSREVSAVSDNGNAPCVEPQTAYRGCGSAEAKLQETGPSLADLSQRLSNFHDTPFRGATEGARSNQSHSEQLVAANGVSEYVSHQEHKRRRVGHHQGNFTKTAIPEGLISSGSEGNGDVTQSRQGKSAGSLCGIDNANPVIPCFLARPSRNKACLKLFKDPVVHTQRRDESLSVQTPTSSSKNKKVAFLLPHKLPDRQQIETNIQTNIQKPVLVSRLWSLPLQEGPSTAFNSLSSPVGHCHVAKPMSAYSRGLSPLKAFSHPFNPKEHSFPPKLWRSCSSSATFEPRKSPAPTVQLNVTGCAKEQVNYCSRIRRPRICSHVTKDIGRRPAPHDKAGTEKAPRKKRQSPKTPTSMMKKATNDAIQWTKNRKRVSQKERSDPVGEGYKWTEKSNVAKPTKGPSRERKGRDDLYDYQ